MLKCYSISNIHFQNNFMFFSVDGENYKISLDKPSQALLRASEKVRQAYRVLDGGYGITWFPAFNEDLSISASINQSEKLLTNYQFKT